ncbi:hypothetical protein SASPL_138538 [Salvia splendens]|uniref:Solute carrier family 50 (Sugar transporter) n=1 Tax=Salvia splendens TaxID=180675 RepID=A0A8X8WVN0_SALSN|nr:hypothetical protein SASPL_138538 [Salvia splendens]
MWCLYGMPSVHPDSLLVITINGIGLVIESFYVGVFFLYSNTWPKRKRVIKTQSVKYLPFYLSLANLANGMVWSTYALVKFDAYILIPNGLGVFSGMVQLGLYAYYYKTTNWDEDEGAQQSDLELHDGHNKA